MTWSCCWWFQNIYRINFRLGTRWKANKLTIRLFYVRKIEMAFETPFVPRGLRWKFCAPGVKDRPVILTSRPGLRGRRRLSADRLPVHQSTLDQEYHFEVDELTDFWRLTVHSMDEFRRKTINSTRWTEVDGQTNDPLTIFHEDYIQLTVWV